MSDEAQEQVPDNSPDRATLSKLDETNASIERLTTASTELTATARIEILAGKQARKRFTIMLLALGLVLLSVSVAIFVVVASGLTSRAQIKDCVQPTGQCFKDAQKRTGEVVGSINQYSALAAACAPSYVGLPLSKRIIAIEDCIVRELKGVAAK